MCPETEIDLLKRLAESAIEDEMTAARRIGKDGAGEWCVSCGHTTNDLSPCICAFPESFRCAGGKTLCHDCRAAHKRVGAFLEQLFSAKKLRVHRADSRRCNFYRFLRGALEVLSEAGDAQARILRMLIGRNADPRSDEPGQFRAGVLEAFRRAHFTDFQKLAKQLAEEERLHYLTKLSTSTYWRM